MVKEVTPRAEPRYVVCRGREVAARVEWSIDENQVSTDGVFRDLSGHGARLTIPEKPPLGECITLQLDVPTLELRFEVAAEVCWVEPAGEAGWTLGCKLSGGFPDAGLEKLAHEDYVDRRQDRRRPINLDAMARWQGTAAGEVPVRLEDFSRAGFRILSPQAGSPGQRLLLAFDSGDKEPVLVTATAAWQVETDEGYHIGCEYGDESAFALLKNRVDHLATTVNVDAVKPDASLRLGAVGWLGMVAFLAWACWIMIWS